jgi:hypothetical protein
MTASGVLAAATWRVEAAPLAFTFFDFPAASELIPSSIFLNPAFFWRRAWFRDPAARVMGP